MNPLIVDSLISAGSSIVNGISNYFSQKNAVSQQNFDSWKQNQLNLAMYYDNLQRNSIKNQMAEYEAAGLNPNLVAGNHVASQPFTYNNVGANPSVGIDKRQQKALVYANISSAISQARNMYYDSKIKQAQYDKLQADISRSEKQENLIRSQVGLNDAKLYGIVNDPLYILYNYMADMSNGSSMWFQRNSDNTITPTQSLFDLGNEWYSKFYRNPNRRSDDLHELGIDQHELNKLRKEMLEKEIDMYDVQNTPIWRVIDLLFRLFGR